MTTLDRDSETFAIIGAAIEVHRERGHGFLEAVYQAALAFELEDRAIPFRREAPLKILYRGKPLALTYKADFLCFETVIVELRATSGLCGNDEAQAINYLRASGHSRALLLNFGGIRLEYRRVVLSRPQSRTDEFDSLGRVGRRY